MNETKTARRHETTIGGVTAYAEDWKHLPHGEVSCWVYVDDEIMVRVRAYSGHFWIHEVVPERHHNTATARVLAAVLQEAAEIAETGTIPGEVREAREGEA